MAINLKEYDDLKSKIEKLKSNADRAEGALEQHMENLKEGFDCSSVKEAKALIKDMTEKQESVETAYDVALEEFKEKWEDKL